MLIATLLAVAELPSIAGDFDHDGKRDRAVFAKRGSSIDLIIWRGVAPTRPVRIRTFYGPSADLYLGKAVPAIELTACGKGYGPDTDHCARKRVSLKGGELLFGVRESSDAVLFWTGLRFEPIYLTD